jgi:hypothetical protein
MTLSAALMALAGLAGSFAPQELLALFGSPATGVLPLLVQLLGALYFAFAMLNWMAREVLIGGIYSRPVALGNFMHFAIGALALVKGASAAQGGPALWTVCALYILFALWFGAVLFGSPVKAPNSGH